MPRYIYQMGKTNVRRNRKEKWKTEREPLTWRPRRRPSRPSPPPLSVVFPRQGHAQLRGRHAVAAGSCLPAWRASGGSPHLILAPRDAQLHSPPSRATSASSLPVFVVERGNRRSTTTRSRGHRRRG